MTIFCNNSDKTDEVLSLQVFRVIILLFIGNLFIGKIRRIYTQAK